MRNGLVVVAALLSAGCLPNCADTDPNPGTGGGGGKSSGSSSISYDLVSALGEWSVAGAGVNGSCTTKTTFSKLTLTLPRPRNNAAHFEAKAGLLTGLADVNVARPARQGTEVCSSTSAACPRSGDLPHDADTFLILSTLEPVPLDAASGAVVVPVLSFELPALCDGMSFQTSPATRRGKPISIAQLTSGQFVVEGSGTAPIFAPPPQPGDGPSNVSGSISWSFRLVFQSPDYDPQKAVASPNLTLYDECLLDLPPTADELEAAAALFADGGTDILLNANGCRRLKATRGPVTRLENERTRGTKFVFDAATNTTHSERDVHVSYVHETDSAGIKERNDVDGDGVFESSTEQTFDGTGQWAKSITRELDTAGVVTRQYTLAKLDPLLMSVSIEQRINGALTPVEAGVAKIIQNSCFGPSSTRAPDCTPAPGPPPTCGGTKLPCMGKQRKDIIKALADATAKGTDCLEKAGFKAFDPNGKALTLVASGKLNLICDADPCGPDYGKLGTKPDLKGMYELTINTARNSNPAELASTLFHEMMHSDDRFFHNDDLVSASAKACKLALSDRTSACEAMCFKPAAAASCACVRCLSPSLDEPSKDVCEKCKKYGDCPGRTEHKANGDAFSVSQAIGAWCDRTKTFCDTKVECDSQCLGNACKQIKGTCDASCN